MHREKKIIVNKIQCQHCLDIIESTSPHDMKWCSCHRVAIDGGKEYLKRYGTDFNELSILRAIEVRELPIHFQNPSSKIFMTGDIHGYIDIDKLNASNFPEGKTLTKNDYVIICGDFGLVWGGANQKSDRYWLKWLSQKPWTTLFVDGNHENHDLLNSYPVDMWHGGKIHRITDSIYHLMRGEIFEINGLNFLAFGGAFSHDIMYREEGISWWQNELPIQTEVDNALDHLEEHHHQVDIILTHDAPTDIHDSLQLYPIDMSPYDVQYINIISFLQSIKETTSYQYWFIGHYHINKNIDNHYILYDDIVELKHQ